MVNKFGIIEGEYIVTFKNQFDRRISEHVARQADQLRKQILTANNIEEKAVLSRYRYAIKGFAAKLDSNQVKALKNDPRIARVSQNAMLQLAISTGLSKGTALWPTKKESRPYNLQVGGQTVPWGISRVNGPFDGTGKTAWILDTGIDFDHDDLNVDTGNSASFIDGEDANDLNGHGTHVAGILGAKNNTSDVVGVAAGATLIPVKVCTRFPLGDPRAGCPINNIMDGVDYVTPRAQPKDIINMSLGGRVTPQNESAVEDMENSISSAATSAGLRFSVSAGNEEEDASNFSPARLGQHSNIWTVSAYDNTDTFANFSNFGNPPIDFGGPGVGIESTSLPGGNTCTQGGTTGFCDGTSMAAPHIAGIVLNQGTNTTTDPGDNPVPTDGTVTDDLDGQPDEIAIASDLNVYVSGPGFVTNGQQDTWTAEVSGGNSPYSYKWFRSNTDPPFWQQVGTGSSYSESVTESFNLKVRVTDDENTTVTSDVFSVATSSGW